MTPPGLVGRVTEVAVLDRLRASAGAAALLTGEAGIGKTAVVEEAVARALAAGATVRTGRAVEGNGVPSRRAIARSSASSIAPVTG